jgi:hypothetical protein
MIRLLLTSVLDVAVRNGKENGSVQIAPAKTKLNSVV